MVEGTQLLYDPIKRWPIVSYEQNEAPLSGEKVVRKTKVHHTMSNDTHDLVDFNKFSSAKRIFRVLSRVIQIFNFRSFKGGSEDQILPSDINEAEKIIIKIVQKSDGHFQGKDGYKRLHPVKYGRGIWRVGLGMSCWNPMANPLNSHQQAFVPADNRFTELLIIDVHHDCGHRGCGGTLARLRHKYWPTKSTAMTKKVKINCQLCRLQLFFLRM